MDSRGDIPVFSEAGFTELFDLLFDGIVMADSRTREFAACNPAFASMLGYGEAELAGTSIFRIHPAESWGAVERAFDDLAAGRIDVAREIPVLTKDGSARFMDIAAKRVVFRDRPHLLAVFHDITDRLGTEKALRRSERMLRSLLDTTPAGLCLLRDRVFATVNLTFCSMVGYTEEELVGKDARLLYHSDEDYEKIARELSETMRAAGRGSAEARLRRKDGSTVDVVMKVGAVNPEDPAAGFMVAYIDVTERKRAEAALRESEGRFSKAFRSSPAPIVITERGTGRFLAANEQFERLVGYKASELIGREGREIGIGFRDRDGEELREELARTGSVRERQVSIAVKGGARREVLISAEAIDLGEREATLSLLLDVTESKKAREALGLNEKVLHGIFEAAPVGLGLAVDRVIKKTNLALCRMVGYHEDEIVGRRLESFMASEKEYESLAQDVAEQIRRKGSGTLQTRLKRKDGARIEAVISLGPVDPKDETAGIAFAVQDVTERQRMEAEKSRLEEMFLHSQKMESIGRLAGGVAHDFNNLLTAIIGNTDMAIELLDPAGKPRALLAQSLRAAEGAANLTKQLLAFSRRQVIELKTLDLNAALEGLKGMMPSLLGENVEFELKPSYGLRAIKADPGQLEQVVVNLAVNARDAMPAGGRLTVSTSNAVVGEEDRVRLGGLAPGEYVTLEISDTGAGMTEEVLDHLFEPFFTTKAKGRGTGLGLATAYGIVKQLGGSVKVDSEVGKGTSFVLYFPASEESAPGPLAALSKSDMPRGRETVLIVEDNPQVLDFSRDALMGLGYTVMTAMTGEEGAAISGAYDGPIDLLITDMILPGANGKQTAERIARERPNMRTIFSSGYTGEVIDTQGMADSGMVFLPKPFTVRDLALKVRSILDGPRA